MKAVKINIFLIFALVYLTPDFCRLMNELPFSGNSSSVIMHQVADSQSANLKKSSLQRRRYLPLTRSNETGKLYPALLPDSQFQSTINEYSFQRQELKINYKSIQTRFSNNKAPPIPF